MTRGPLVLAVPDLHGTAMTARRPSTRSHPHRGAPVARVTRARVPAARARGDGARLEARRSPPSAAPTGRSRGQVCGVSRADPRLVARPVQPGPTMHQARRDARPWCRCTAIDPCRPLRPGRTGRNAQVYICIPTSHQIARRRHATLGGLSWGLMQTRTRIPGIVVAAPRAHDAAPPSGSQRICPGRDRARQPARYHHQRRRRGSVAQWAAAAEVGSNVRG
jgi:hypothetical protein